ncbi:MAG TPA: transposase [Candidatus Binataceae bacterium]|nr:transposase [Candidatus Binataceae bacterium]
MTRLSKSGNARLRTAFWMAAKAAVRMRANRDSRKTCGQDLLAGRGSAATGQRVSYFGCLLCDSRRGATHEDSSEFRTEFWRSSVFGHESTAPAWCDPARSIVGGQPP